MSFLAFLILSVYLVLISALGYLAGRIIGNALKDYLGRKLQLDTPVSGETENDVDWFES